jgi:hypothetical protein
MDNDIEVLLFSFILFKQIFKKIKRGPDGPLLYVKYKIIVYGAILGLISFAVFLILFIKEKKN